MLRIGIGILGILVGTVGLFYEWLRLEKRNIRQLELMQDLVQKAIFAIETECKRSKEFLEEYRAKECKDALLNEVLGQVILNLESNTFPTGKKAWSIAWEKYQKKWKGKEEEWNAIISMGEAFFGRDRKEMSRQMKGWEERLKELEYRRTEELKERQKMYMPLSISGGFLIILLLI